MTKEDHIVPATNLFNGLGVNVTAHGRPYLGAAKWKNGFPVSILSATLPDLNLKLPFPPLLMVCKTSEHFLAECYRISAPYSGLLMWL